MKFLGAHVTFIKTKVTRIKFPRKELTHEMENCERNTQSVIEEGGNFGCGVPCSIAHGLTNNAELFSDRFFTFSFETYQVFDAKSQ